MTERQQLLEAIATTIADYRAGDLATPTPEHVERWVKQFDTDAQLSMLRELNHVMEKTYFSRKSVKKFMKALVNSEKLAGKAPCDYWRKANFLDIQKNGHSQKEMLLLFGEVLQKSCGFSIAECGSKSGDFIFLDDAIFSGTSIRNDLVRWVGKDAPSQACVQVISIAIYTGSEWTFRVPIPKAVAEAKKKISIHRWRAIELENQKQNKNASEVLWPIGLPAVAGVQAYAASEERFPFQPRQAGGKLVNQIFFSEEGRQILESELLIAGVKIRSFSQDPKPILRPLGFSQFGLGFGSTIVTYRNCPNNAPLAFWWGDPKAAKTHPFSKWYPLFPRKTYQGVSLDDFDFL